MNKVSITLSAVQPAVLVTAQCTPHAPLGPHTLLCIGLIVMLLVVYPLSLYSPDIVLSTDGVVTSIQFHWYVSVVGLSLVTLYTAVPPSQVCELPLALLITGSAFTVTVTDVGIVKQPLASVPIRLLIFFVSVAEPLLQV